MHLNHIAIFFYRTSMAYIFHRKYISRIDQPNWNHIFLMYILFIKHFPRKQQLQELTKALYKCIPKLTAKVTSVLPTLTRTQRCPWHGPRSSGSRPLPCMAERWRGSLPVRCPRPWRGEWRCSEASATRCGARAREKRAGCEAERRCP